MRKLLVLMVLASWASIASAQSSIFRYGGTTVISSSTFTSAMIAPPLVGEQIVVTHWFAEPTSGAIVSFWFSSNATCIPVTAAGITSMTIANNSPIADGDGNGVIVAGPVGNALCAQAVTQPIPGLVTYGLVP